MMDKKVIYTLKSHVVYFSAYCLMPILPRFCYLLPVSLALVVQGG